MNKKFRKLLRNPKLFFRDMYEKRKHQLNKIPPITKVNGRELAQSLAYEIQSHKVGEEITLEVWREGKTFTVKITLAQAE